VDCRRLSPRAGRALPDRPAAADLTLVALGDGEAFETCHTRHGHESAPGPVHAIRRSRRPAELRESVRGHGLRHSLGELVTCPFCMSQWIATGLTFGLILSPRVARQVAGTLLGARSRGLMQFVHAFADKQSS